MRVVFAARLKARTMSVLMAGECHRVVYMNWSGSEKNVKELFQTRVQSSLMSSLYQNKNAL